MEPRLTILHFEDSQEDALLIREHLESGGIQCDVSLVQNRASFVKALGDRWDLILSDFNVPGFDGFAALQLVRERDPHIPFIIISGTIGEEVAIESLKRGATDYILKDKPARLVPAVQRALQQAEERRQRLQSETALVKSEERYRTLVSSLREGLLEADNDDVIQFVNDQLCVSLGYQRDELLGHVVHRLLVSEDDQAQIVEKNLQLRRGISERYEIRCLHKDGHSLWMEISASPVADPRGAVIGYVATFSDITEKRLLQEQFLRAQRLEGIGTLAGGIAHDLNNVLGPILLSLEVMRKKVQDPGLLRMIDTIEASGKRGADLIKQVLSFARGLHGEHVTVQVRHLVGEVESIMKETFPKSIAVATKAPNNLWPVSGDATQLHQVLMNLCVNARDAMPDGGRLELKCENVELDEQYVAMHFEAKLGRYVCLSVTDTGVGIPPDIKAKIFDPFYTTKEIGKGTGLGLSTVLTIVKSHGGFINVYSEPGKGAAFRVYLPVRTSDVPEKLQEQEDLVAGKGELVLVVDDEEAVREITRTTLEAFGYAVVTANDGTDAISKYVLEKDRIALVVTDMMMPYMDGPATIRALRKLNPNVSILAVGGLPQDGQVTDGASDIAFLHKPYTAQKLLEFIRRVLDSKSKH